MLDLQKTGLPQIIDAMVKKLLEKKEVSSQTSLEEARHAIFTQDSGENQTLWVEILGRVKLSVIVF